jgi:hypothetical protein
VCLYLPDDRTIVMDQERAIRKLATGEAHTLPAFLRSAAWEQARKGVVAVAINPQDRALAEEYDLGRTDDAMVLPLFKDALQWTLSVEDADAMVVRAAAACRDARASEALTRTVESLVKLGSLEVEHALDDPEVRTVDSHVRATRMTKAFLANLRTERTDRSIAVSTSGFGTFADLAAIVQAESKCACKARNKKMMDQAQSGAK